MEIFASETDTQNNNFVANFGYCDTNQRIVKEQHTKVDLSHP